MITPLRLKGGSCAGFHHGIVTHFLAEAVITTCGLRLRDPSLSCDFYRSPGARAEWEGTRSCPAPAAALRTGEPSPAARRVTPESVWHNSIIWTSSWNIVWHNSSISRDVVVIILLLNSACLFCTRVHAKSKVAGRIMPFSAANA